jgi:hypothetical protein
MPDETTSATGFRSLVEKIQENDSGYDERDRPMRRRPMVRRDPRPEAAAPAQAPATNRDLTVRLLERRWL